MNYDTTQTKENPRAGRVFMALIALGCAMGAAPGAPAQSLAAPTTPPLIAAPAGNSLFLAAQATGTQGYVCLPTSTGAPTASWTVKGSRPQATLFQRFFGQEFQIATHFLSPDTNPNGAAPSPLPFGSATWQSSLDSSLAGPRCCMRPRFPPAPTRVVRIPARSLVSYWSPSDRKRARPEEPCWRGPPLFND
jgi:hypothetical protein